MRERKLGLTGKKIGMTQIFTDAGLALGVTVLEMGPCVVIAKKSKAKNSRGRSDGYSALQLGFDTKPERKVNKADAGQLKAAGGIEKARRYVSEMRVSDETLAKFEIGQEITLKDLDLKVGDKIDVVGISKGNGFQGVMARHNFGGFRATHGTHEYFRHGGSIGSNKFPGRVFKGRKMPGHGGAKRVSIQNVPIAEIRTEDNLLLINGSVPGAPNSYVTVKPAIKLNPDA